MTKKTDARWLNTEPQHFDQSVTDRLTVLLDPDGGLESTAAGIRLKRRYGLMTANFDFSGTGLVDITGLSFDVLNGEQWIFEARIHTVSLNAAADLRFGVTGAATGIFTGTNPENAVSKTAAIGAATTNIPVATSTGVNADMLIVSGRLEATADTTIQVQVQNNAGNTVQTFSQWSYLTADRIL